MAIWPTTFVPERTVPSCAIDMSSALPTVIGLPSVPRSSWPAVVTRRPCASSASWPLRV